MVKINNTAKIIFHIDLNMFFCSVAVIKNPQLKGKAFAIGRENTYKGVLSTASYEARKYGIHSAMPIVEAYKKLPSLIVINSDFKMYEEYHRKFVDLLREYSELVEVASIDEAYIDMTEISNDRHPLDIAKEIQYRLIKEHKLPCSIGIAPTLFLAKMASDLEKPMGISIVRKREIEQILYPLPVKDIYGIGKKTYPKLQSNNINKISDFMDIKNRDMIIELIGEKSFFGAYNAILGNSSNVVKPDRYAINDSISTSATYDNYLTTYDDIFIELRTLAKKIHYRLVTDEYHVKTISITLRNNDFKTITRSKTIEYTNDIYEIFEVIESLLDDYYTGEEIRLVGVSFNNLKKDKDIEIEWNLFTYQTLLEKTKHITELVDSFKDKFGENIIKIGIKD